MYLQNCRFDFIVIILIPTVFGYTQWIVTSNTTENGITVMANISLTIGIDNQSISACVNHQSNYAGENDSIQMFMSGLFHECSHFCNFTVQQTNISFQYSFGEQSFELWKLLNIQVETWRSELIYDGSIFDVRDILCGSFPYRPITTCSSSECFKFYACAMGLLNDTPVCASVPTTTTTLSTTPTTTSLTTTALSNSYNEYVINSNLTQNGLTIISTIILTIGSINEPIFVCVYYKSSYNGTDVIKLVYNQGEQNCSPNCSLVVGKSILKFEYLYEQNSIFLWKNFALETNPYDRGIVLFNNNTYFPGEIRCGIRPMKRQVNATLPEQYIYSVSACARTDVYERKSCDEIPTHSTTLASFSTFSSSISTTSSSTLTTSSSNSTLIVPTSNFLTSTKAITSPITTMPTTVSTTTTTTSSTTMSTTFTTSTSTSTSTSTTSISTSTTPTSTSTSMTVSSTTSTLSSSSVSTTLPVTENITTVTFYPSDPYPTHPPFSNCSGTRDGVEKIYCQLLKTDVVPGNITKILNQTLVNLNVATMNYTDLMFAIGIFEMCSEVKNLTKDDTWFMAYFLDQILCSPEDSYVKSNDQNTSTIALESISRMMLNSPKNVSYFTGKNLGLMKRQIDCTNQKNAFQLSDDGTSFNSGSKSITEIFIDSTTACLVGTTEIHYLIYRNSKFFLGDSKKSTGIWRGSKNFIKPLKTDSTTTAEHVGNDCNIGFQETDGRVATATPIVEKNGLKKLADGIIVEVENFEGHQLLHKVFIGQNEQNLVHLKFSKQHYGVALHGKMKVSWFDILQRQWSKETCTVTENNGFYESTCTHLTDFSLIVDGSSQDPILCDSGLEVINYIVTIGSLLSLLILNILYAMIALRLSEKVVFLQNFKNEDETQFIYAFLQLLFFFIFIIFTKESRTTGKKGCITVAILNYLILMACVILSLFKSWKMLKLVAQRAQIENYITIITNRKIMYSMIVVIPIIFALGFGFGTNGQFFYRNDSFCWIRSDYVWAGVILPLTILGINGILCSIIIFLTLFPKIPFANFARGSSVVISSKNEKNVKQRLIVLFFAQFALGVPWLLQYLSLFRSSATIWHYLFSIINGLQGFIQLFSFLYQSYAKSKRLKSIYSVKTLTSWLSTKKDWFYSRKRKSGKNDEIPQRPDIGIEEHEPTFHDIESDIEGKSVEPENPLTRNRRQRGVKKLIPLEHEIKMKHEDGFQGMTKNMAAMNNEQPKPTGNELLLFNAQEIDQNIPLWENAVPGMKPQEHQNIAKKSLSFDLKSETTEPVQLVQEPKSVIEELEDKKAEFPNQTRLKRETKPDDKSESEQSRFNEHDVIERFPPFRPSHRGSSNSTSSKK